MKKLANCALVAILIVSMVTFATPAQAQTTTQVTIQQLQALIASLQAQLAALMGQTQVPIQGAYLFTADLTVGSTGPDVIRLQQYLVAQGYLVIPPGVSYGYFGPLTRSAVASWQGAQGISPTAGYFGPISRARLNAILAAQTPTTPPTSGGGVITTPGVEGTLVVTVNPTPSSGSTAREGDNKVPVMGIKLEALRSDIRIERIQVQLPNASFYNNIANRIYVADGSNVLAESALNSSTVLRENSTFTINLIGVNYVVPKDSTRVLTVLLDLYPSVDSQYENQNFTLVVPSDGVRGVDGAGISQYGPSSSISRTFRVQQNLAESATLRLSLSPNSPLSANVVASEGSNENELDNLTVLAFNLRAERDDVLVTDINATVNGTGSATTSVAYLYSGSTLIGSANVSGNTVLFNDIDTVIPANTSKELTLRIDVRNAASTASTFSASVSSSGITAENSLGEALSGSDVSGSATGETFTVTNIGPQFTIVSKDLVKSQTPQQGGFSTTTARATFNIRVKATGGDVVLGTQASTSPMVIFGIYKGGVLQPLNVASSSNVTIPSSGVITSGVGPNSFMIQENNEVTIPVEFVFEGRTASGSFIPTDSYAIGIEGIRWSTDNGATTQTTTFMSGNLNWRTSSAIMP